MYRYFKKIGNIHHISERKSKELSDESYNAPATSGNSLAPSLNYIGTKTRITFEVQCLKQDKITFTHGKTVIIYIAYEINLWDCGYLTLENFLFGAVKLVKNSDIDKYKNFGCGNGFDRCETFPVANGFGNMSSS